MLDPPYAVRIMLDISSALALGLPWLSRFSGNIFLYIVTGKILPSAPVSTLHLSGIILCDSILCTFSEVNTWLHLFSLSTLFIVIDSRVKCSKLFCNTSGGSSSSFSSWKECITRPLVQFPDHDRRLRLPRPRPRRLQPFWKYTLFCGYSPSVSLCWGPCHGDCPRQGGCPRHEVLPWWELCQRRWGFCSYLFCQWVFCWSALPLLD